MGIALVALAIGVAALRFAQPEHQVGTAHAAAVETEAHGHAGEPVARDVATDPAQVQRVSVRMTEFAFEPRQVVVKVNQPVEVTVQNDGKAPHDRSPQGIGQAVHVHAGPAESVTGRFTPTAVGTFKVICSEPGHEQLGMVSELVVQP